MSFLSPNQQCVCQSKVVKEQQSTEPKQLSCLIIHHFEHRLLVEGVLLLLCWLREADNRSMIQLVIFVWKIKAQLSCVMRLICRRARGDPRGVVSYNDLDAPPDVD